MTFEEKKYLIDGKPASANDIIAEAEAYDDDFGSDGFKSTSRAAEILRKWAHTVETA